MAVLLLPGRPHDVAALRAAYLRNLQSYEGTIYVWGGETHLGIDCSGLVRAAMVDATFSESVRTANPRLLREALWLWWNDIAARDMPAGYSGKMIRITDNVTLRQASADDLQPGDAAVTADGSHVIAYLGHDEWIEADPATMRVQRLPITGASPWLNMHYYIIRWRCLTL